MNPQTNPQRKFSRGNFWRILLIIFWRGPYQKFYYLLEQIHAEILVEILRGIPEKVLKDEDMSEPWGKYERIFGASSG